MQFEGSIIELDSSRDKIYEDLANNIGSEGMELQDYSKEIVMMVDENGYYKSSYPIFQIKTTFGDIVELAGSIIFGRNIETEESTDIGGISHDDILFLRDSLKIKLVGITKGYKNVLSEM